MGNRIYTMQKNILTSLFMAGILGITASFAGAQSYPSPTPYPQGSPTPIPIPTLPPNTKNAAIIQTIINLGQQILQRQQEINRNNISGTVSYFRRFDMQVQCGTNCYRNVHLHQGTVINPRGGTPSQGTYVDINGSANSDGSLEANTINIRQ